MYCVLGNAFLKSIAAAAAKSLQSCPTLRPHRRQPTRPRRPWDSPGKNTGVGCHFLLQCMKVKSESEVAQSFSTLSDPMDCSLPGSSIHGIFQARVLEWGAIVFLPLAKRQKFFSHLPFQVTSQFSLLSHSGSCVCPFSPGILGRKAKVYALSMQYSVENRNASTVQ